MDYPYQNGKNHPKGHEADGACEKHSEMQTKKKKGESSARRNPCDTTLISSDTETS